MRKIYLCTIKLLAISLFLIHVSSALDFTFTHPEEVELDDEFTVSIDLDSSETYDVKVFIHKSNDKKIERSEYISEILNDDWSDPWYYIAEAFPNDKEFKIRSLESGEHNICVRLRSETKSTFTECKNISILISNQDPVTNSNSQKISEDSEINPATTIVSPDFIPSNTPNKISPINIKPPQKLILDNLDSDSEKIISTNSNNKRQWIIYSFLGLTIVIIILLALKRL